MSIKKQRKAQVFVHVLTPLATNETSNETGFPMDLIEGEPEYAISVRVNPYKCDLFDENRESLPPPLSIIYTRPFRISTTQGNTR